MNGKAWLGRFLSRKATHKASRRPASPLRELEQEQAALRARLDALGAALDAASAALPEQERTALCHVRDEARALCGRACGRLAAFRRTCWLVILIQLCLLAAMLASFRFFLPEL
ncbi:hypothetical protein [uncultured Desulfovibrio sp.]|uniref:hypothetical protein n=1 Tax=uncultured Desulfovibrio sp. TaxID=167968 RepID=UPI002805DB45|nr:hypothetical protein [uncultured Desulfovibrio sp.]